MIEVLHCVRLFYSHIILNFFFFFFRLITEMCEIESSVKQCADTPADTAAGALTWWRCAGNANGGGGSSEIALFSLSVDLHCRL